MNCFILILVVAIAGVRSYPTKVSNFDESSPHWNPRAKRVKKESALVSDESTVPAASMNLADAKSAMLDKRSRDYDDEMKPYITIQGRKLEKLLAELTKISPKDKDRRFNGDQTQGLKEIKSVPREHDANDVTKSKWTDVKVTEVTDLTSLAKPVPTVVRIWQDTEAALKMSKASDSTAVEQDERPSNTRSTDASIRAVGQDSMIDIDLTSIKTEADLIDYMLAEALAQLTKIRTYFDQICRKHHSTLAASNALREFNTNESSNAS